MMKRKVLAMATGSMFMLVLAPAVAIVSHATAAVINADNHPALAGKTHRNAVLDETTDRLWLDITESVGFSINEISGMLSSGQEFEGWQLPELADVEELLLNANIPYPTAPPGGGFGSLPGFNQPISDFLDIFGSPSETDLGDQAEMWIRASIDGVPVVRIILSDGEFGSLDAHRARVHISPPGFDHGDSVFATIGTALYRSVPGNSDGTVVLGGVIDEDTVWTVEGSQYLLGGGDLIVASNVTLELEPGVVVDTRGNGVGILLISGRLVADGTLENPIHLIGEGRIVFSVKAAPGSILRNCEIVDVNFEVEKDFPLLENVIFSGNYELVTTLREYRADNITIRNCMFEDALGGIVLNYSNSLILDNCQIDNDLNIVDSRTLQIDRNTLTKNLELRNDPGAPSTGSITNNVIVTPTEITIDRFAGVIRNNDISVATIWTGNASTTWELNRIELLFEESSTSRLSIRNPAIPYVLRFNNFVGSGTRDDLNQDFLIHVHGGRGLPITAIDNWWGTNDPSEVEDLIHDFFDEGSAAYVNYVPFRDSPVPARGDFDDDHDTDGQDFDQFELCFTGAGGEWTPECEAGDFDLDGDIDCDDWEAFKAAWTGPPAEPPLSIHCDCEQIVIVASDPPDGTIDVLQDRSTTGLTPQGVDRVQITFNCPATDELGDPLTVDNFEITDTGGTPPAVLSVTPLDIQDTSFEVVFTDPITSGEWTTVLAHVYGPTGFPIEEGVGDRVTFGFLPGDIDLSGTATGGDILALIDSMNSVPGRILPDSRTDVNRSGVTTGADILRLIDLLNGVNTTRAWIAASLPEKP